MNNETIYRWTQQYFANYKVRLAIAAIATIAVFVFFPFIYASQGSASGALISIVILFDTILLGTKVGVFVWILSMPIWILHLTGLGVDGIEEFKRGLIPTLGTLLLTLAIGAVKKSVRTVWQKHESESALFQALIEKSTDGVILIDEKGIFKYISPVARRMFGYAPTDDIPPEPAAMTFPDDLPMVLSHLGRLLQDPAYVPTIEYRFRNKAGGWQWVESTFSNLLGEPHVQAIVINFRDITEQKRLKQQLLQAQKLEGVGTLAGGIAHDFNNLLAVVLGAAELLQSRVSDQPELKKFVDRIIEASERGTSISRQLLIFSRPDQAELKPISLSHTILELRDMLRHFLPKSIDVQTSIDVERGIMMGDKGQIHQALLNLALNAGDAMTNRGTLTIREYSVGADLILKKFSFSDTVPYVAVSVADTGSGIEPSFLDKIFDPFFSTKERGKGTGLGLAMVHGIVKNHKGFIDVTSLPGEGTTFTLYFPTVGVEEPRQEHVDASAPRGATPKGTILLVDDEEYIRELYAEYLHELGYTVRMAENGIRALEVFTTHRSEIDLVVTDLGMSGMGGEELFRRLHQLDPSVKVIVSSGYLDGVTKEHLLSLGILEVLTKPSKFREIERTLSAALAESSTAVSVNKN